MRELWGSLAAALLTISGALAQQLPTPQSKLVTLKGDFTYFEKTWGLKVKGLSAEVVELKQPDGGIRLLGTITYLLEFGHDIDGYDLDELQRTVVHRKDGEVRKIRHLFFDENDVAFETQYHYRSLVGDVSGVKGEAFQVTVDFNERAIRYTKKLVVRTGSGHR